MAKLHQPLTAEERAARDARKRMYHERALGFHTRNPHVYVMLAAGAREALKAGVKNASMQDLMGHVRWMTKTRTGKALSLPLNLASYYARLLSVQEQGMSELFAIRELR